VQNIPDSVKTIELNFLGVNNSYIYKLDVIDGKVNKEIIIDNSGKYEIKNNLAPDKSEYIRVIPGWLSIIPPLLAILLALLIRQVIVSLLAGIYVGAIFLYDFNPFTALLRLSDTIILNVLVDADHMYVIVFTLLIGGVVGIISKNGGTTGLANQITKLAKTAKSGMIASWLMGVVIFFDDYANSLIIGNMMRPITDKLKISREKLSYIVDSTAAPVASIVIISTWIGYELGLINEGLKAIGSAENAYDVFIKTIPIITIGLIRILYIMNILTCKEIFRQ
jgi:Na+/H+ antiporter NhaC